MRRGRAVTQKLHRRDRLGQSVERPAHGRHSHLIVEIPVETGRNQPLEPGEVLWLSVQRRYLGEHLSDHTGELLLIVGRQFGEDVGEEGPLHQLWDELALGHACRGVGVQIDPLQFGVGIALGIEGSARPVQRQEGRVRPQSQRDHAGQEDGLDLLLDTREQVLTARQRVGREKKQERIGWLVVLGVPEVAELHGQGKHDEVQDGKPDERGFGRVGTGGPGTRFAGGDAGPPHLIVDSSRVGSDRLQP